MKRDIIHIIVDDRYGLSEEDMQSIMKIFETAKADPSGSVIVTASGIRARVISISDGDEIRVVTAEVPSHIIEQVIETNGQDEEE